MKLVLIFLLSLVSTLSVFGQMPYSKYAKNLHGPDFELGYIDWYKDYDHILYLGDGGWKTFRDGKVGYFHNSLGLIISPKYQDVLQLDSTNIGVKDGDKWAIFSDGEFITDFIFGFVLAKEGDYYIVSQSGSYGFYKDGEFIEEDFYVATDLDKPPGFCDPVTGNCDLSSKEVTTLLSRSMRYPANARENGIQGLVVVVLYISELGDLDYVYIGKSEGELLDNASINLFTDTFNRFRPAEKDGISVPSIMFFPLRYRLE